MLAPLISLFHVSGRIKMCQRLIWSLAIEILILCESVMTFYF